MSTHHPYNPNSKNRSIHLTVNGQAYDLAVGGTPGGVAPSDSLAHTLRETLGLTGTKIGCGEGACGSCTVLIDGEPILSCITLTVECDGRQITTIEGLEDRQTGQLHPLQEAFIENTAFQCGFCTPGILMSAKALLDKDPSPSEAAVKKALAGHYCRCISHYEVVKAVSDATIKGGRHD
jgi:carbon-monoxide dehydrogenase small subunit